MSRRRRDRRSRQIASVPSSVKPVEYHPPVENRDLAAVAMAGVVVLTAGLTLCAMSNNDIWIHLTTGDLILRNHSIPRTDPYSFTASDHPYLAHEWLSAVFFSLVDRAGGIPALTLSKFLVVLVSNVFLFLTCRLRRDRLAIVLPAFVLLGYVGAQRYLERPHIFTFLFCSLYLYLLFRFRDGDRRRASLVAIVPLHVLWVNLHSSFFLGLGLLAVFGAASFGEWVRKDLLEKRGENDLTGKEVALLCGLPFVCLAASLLNPHGVRLLEFPFQLTGMEIYMAKIFEWRPPLDPVFNSTYMFYGYWVWVVLLIGSFVVPSRREGAAQPGWRLPLDIVFAAAFLLFAYAFMWRPEWLTQHRAPWVAIAGIYCAVNLRRLDFTAAGLVTVALFLSLRHNRHVADAMTITFPVFAHNLTRILNDVEGMFARTAWRRRSQTVNAVVVCVLSLALVLLAVQIQMFGYHYNRAGVRQGGIGIADNMPVCAVDYVARNGLSGNAFTSYTTAALLIRRRYPEVKVNMDSRNEVYGPVLFREYEKAKRDPSAMREYLETNHVDFFLVAHVDLAPKVWTYLLRSGNWVQVFFDDRTVVLARKDETDPALVERDGYKVVFPQLLPGGVIPRQHTRAYLRESTRAITQCPDSWLPRWYRAQALLRLKRPAEARRELRNVLARRPDAWQAWALLGGLRETAGETAAAAAAYRKVLEANPGNRAAEAALSRLQGS